MHDDFGYLAQIPRTTQLVDYVFGSGPSGLVGLGRIEVGATTEDHEEEGDEDPSLEDGPSVGQPLPGLLAAAQIVNHADEVADEDDGTPNEKHVENRLRHINAQHPQGDSDD